MMIRSHGYSRRVADDVYYSGYIGDAMHGVHYDNQAVRPAIWIDLVAAQ